MMWLINSTVRIITNTFVGQLMIVLLFSKWIIKYARKIKRGIIG